MRRSIAAAVVLMVCGGAGDAGAASIGHIAQLESNTQPGFIPYFDSGGVTLTGVGIAASGRVDQEIHLTGSFEEPYSGTYQLIVVFIGSPPGVGPSPEFPAYYGPVTPIAPSRIDYLDLHDSFDYRSATITAPAWLAEFVGTGRYNLQVAAHYDVPITPRHDLFYQEIAFVNGTATVTYDFISTPEPASVVTMSLGLAAVAGLAWRRRRVR